MKHFLILPAFLFGTVLLFGVQNSPDRSITTDEQQDTICDPFENSELSKKLANAKTEDEQWALILEALTVKGEASDAAYMESQKNKEQQALETAVKIHSNRFRQNLACSPGTVQSGDKSLYNNHLVGISYYNYANGPAPYGESLSIWFNRSECELETNYNGVVGMHYQKMQKEVVIVSRFRQVALRIPYPFPKHIFKAKGGVCIPRFSTTSQVEFMSVPPIQPCSNISDEQLLERLKGQKFVGYTRKDKFDLTLGDGTIVNPFMYTVVEFHKEGYVSICYPAADYVFIPDGTYSVRGSVIKVGGENFGLVKNNGDAVNLQSPYSDIVYKLSDTFSPTSTTSRSTTTKTKATQRKTAPNKNRTKIQKKSTRR